MKFAVDFEGWIEVEAKDKDEAQDIFWHWVSEAQNFALGSYYKKVILKTPHFDFDGAECLEEP